uniref:Receptor (G protein-coupled) activity modifying protein 2 n=1 Tax=Labrus bergylta TaxID=56723 RepID=A0A3Q3GAE0_9LABR|nr:receptor activity-modifying protein 2 isoform X2 [Labrus bergylta]
MPCCTQSKKLSFNIVHGDQSGKTHLYSFSSDMKGALGFIGVFLSFLSDATYGGPPWPYTYAACGNNSQNCGQYCSFCSQYQGTIMDCLSLLFEHLCLVKFRNTMASLNDTEWCIWGNVRGLYSNLSLCTEQISDCLLIPWPNPLVEETFVNIHSTFFKECPSEELRDPSPAIVFALVITPICLIPVMVSLVVLKTKNGDGSS